MDRDSIKISVRDDASAILNGVAASDSKDGDVSDILVVESLSNFIEKEIPEGFPVFSSTSAEDFNSKEPSLIFLSTASWSSLEKFFNNPG